ncbi:Thioredoxin H-type [Cucurbita argyrosperma subsp. argyrosperma]|uniref:Thioredoxin H1-like n=2 Tax=Cucurbita TaxID=3660 RepID=A0A6J1GID1_CUCMO|nr:thioredoxin H1-like [Cucurbita moschata]KAG7020482.1 Thioredoxin H-type [Cucurbita argyrosperma subsp. argyrosperma]
MAVEGQVIPLRDAKEFDVIIDKEKESGKLIVIDFTASWCPPCRIIAPVFAELAKAHVNVTFLKVDVDNVKEIAERFEVNAMPTFVFLKGGKEVHRIVGADKVELGVKVLELSAAPATSAA